MNFTRLAGSVITFTAVLLVAPFFATAQESDAAAKAREARRAARERIRQAQQQQGQTTAAPQSPGQPPAVAGQPPTPTTLTPPTTPPPLGDGALPRVALEIGTGSEVWGRVVIELDQKKAPGTVRNFLQYVESGFYDGVVFHRVLPGFIVQTGGYTAIDQKKEPTRPPISNEARTAGKNLRATVAMARAKQPHTAATQFFFNMKDNPGLDADCPEGDGWGYAVFGRVVEGFHVIERIQSLPTRANPAIPTEMSVPTDPPMIRRATKVLDGATGGQNGASPSGNPQNNQVSRPRGRVRPGQTTPPQPTPAPPQPVPGRPPVGGPVPPSPVPQPVPEPAPEPMPEETPPDVEQQQEEQGKEQIPPEVQPPPPQPAPPN